MDTVLGFGNVEGELKDVLWGIVPMGFGGGRSYRRTHASLLTVLTGRERAGSEVTALCSGSPGKESEVLRRWHGAPGIKQGKFAGKGDKVRYPNIGGDELKEEQVPGILRRKFEERLKNGSCLKKGAAANSRMPDECEDGFALLQESGLVVLYMGWTLTAE